MGFLPIMDNDKDEVHGIVNFYFCIDLIYYRCRWQRGDNNNRATQTKSAAVNNVL